MKSGNHDKAEGTTKGAKGKAEKAAGKALGDNELQNKGRRDEAEGKLQKSRGDLKKAVGR